MDQPDFEYTFKILLVGDSGVGKSSLLMRFATGNFDELSPTIGKPFIIYTTYYIIRIPFDALRLSFPQPVAGVDFKAKIITISGKKVKLTIWDTAGQERFRTLTSSYYRGAQGIIFVFDVTRRETFESLGDIWMREVDMYGTVEDSVKMVVANKTDLADLREVTKEEGIDFARSHGCLYVETSAKGNVAVDQAFEELVLKVLETPSLLTGTTSQFGLKRMKQSNTASSCCY